MYLYWPKTIQYRYLFAHNSLSNFGSLAPVLKTGSELNRFPVSGKGVTVFVPPSVLRLSMYCTAKLQHRWPDHCQTVHMQDTHPHASRLQIVVCAAQPQILKPSWEHSSTLAYTPTHTHNIKINGACWGKLNRSGLLGIQWQVKHSHRDDWSLSRAKDPHANATQRAPASICAWGRALTG